MQARLPPHPWSLSTRYSEDDGQTLSLSMAILPATLLSAAPIPVGRSCFVLSAGLSVSPFCQLSHHPGFRARSYSPPAARPGARVAGNPRLGESAGGTVTSTCSLKCWCPPQRGVNLPPQRHP